MSVTAELIEEIIKHLIGDPRLRELLQQAGQTAPPAPTDPAILVVLAGPVPTGTLAAVRERWGAGNLQVVAMPELRAQVSLPQGMAWLEPLAAYERTHWSSIVVPVCPPGLLAKIALGLRDDFAADLLGRSLMAGCPVEILRLELECGRRTHASYLNLYAEYVAKIRSYGVVIRQLPDGLASAVPAAEPAGSALRSPSGETPETVQRREPAAISFERKLLAERDALGFPEGSLVQVNARTVISPLALDVLRLRRITLKREGG